MAQQFPTTLPQTVLDVLERGLPQDAAVAHFIHSTYGDLSPSELSALLADRDDPQTASLVELLLFPGEAVALILEPALASARLDADGASALAEALAEAPPRAVAVMPDGSRLTVPLSPDDARHFVARLSPQRSLPEDAARLLAQRFSPDDALALAVTARQSGPDWTPAAKAFFRTLATRLDADAPKALDTLRFALRFLRGLAKDALPLPALAARRAQLAAQLRRARQQEEALAKSNYETLVMTGARLPYLHAPDIAHELALADAALTAATGRPPDESSACNWDMGTIADVDGMLAAFDDQAG
jgi:hypothetical protein